MRLAGEETNVLVGNGIWRSCGGAILIAKPFHSSQICVHQTEWYLMMIVYTQPPSMHIATICFVPLNLSMPAYVVSIVLLRNELLLFLVYSPKVLYVISNKVDLLAYRTINALTPNVDLRTL